MTTYIVDDKSAACDSMWSDPDGVRCDVPINKYLYIDQPIDGVDLQPCLILYSGDYEQLVLNQSFKLGMINIDQYTVAVDNYRKLGRGSLSYVSVSLDQWTPDRFNCQSELGVLFDGSGGGMAFTHYRDNYCVKRAVEHAIENDPKSDHEINYFYRALAGSLVCESFAPLDVDMYNEIYKHTEELHQALQSGEMGVGMNKLRYAGCSTSPAVEAQSFSTSHLLDQQVKELAKNKKLKQQLLESNVTPIKTKKITPKKMDSSAFSFSIV
ncbi:hypothetical protein [Enterovibrio paralichthyis]|uniref:hypothetical protein n=1 Tax=Enterovibrio paralichthyis TaxID=2853805 RepID=UPI001C45F43E|nr:hypothetical protein [Enterovibrio paralichthyis]MBV7297720.1 hypothetical protein [Enterovibrio paralichthyis]